MWFLNKSATLGENAIEMTLGNTFGGSFKLFDIRQFAPRNTEIFNIHTKHQRTRPVICLTMII